MNDDAHRSIGEVLALLKPEFADVTISKIRFLETQGLVEPERTPSGYRKFSEGDVARLRWILAQQRDNFLPLKVIKEKLDAGDWAFGAELRHDATIDAEIVNPLDVGPASISMNIDELASTSGLTRVQLKALEDAGVVVGRQVGGATIYDDDALLVTRASAGLLEMGLEVRHLRSYKVAAEREAGVLEQLLAAQAHNRSPEARHQTTQALGKLVILGEELRRAMLRRSLRGSIIH